MKFETQPNPEQKIGAGGYKEAYKIEGASGPEVHLSFKHAYTNEQIKSVFYLNRIATLLFPGKIARISQAGNAIDDAENKSSQAFAEYIDSSADPEHLDLQKGYSTLYEGPDEESDPHFDNIWAQRLERMEKDPEVQAFLDKYEEAGLVAGFGKSLRWGPQDLIFQKDGTFTFVDVDVAWDEPEDLYKKGYSRDLLRFDPKKLQTAINKLKEEDRNQAQAAYNQLITLCRKAGINI